MNFAESLNYLLSLGHETLALKLGLRNTELVLAALHNPQTTFPSVQIAGTNGKGSTAVMLDYICQAAGIKSGLFTSPHLVSITERISVQGQEISQTDFACFATSVRAVAKGLVERRELEALPTFFEQVTALAFLAFAEARVDLAILETGLGGRLDATTVARAATVAITPIDLDHQEYLGSTLAEIAAEKAAIIRPGTTVIVAPQHPVALQVILDRCKDCDVEPRIDDCATTVLGATREGRLRVTFETKQDRYESVTVGLRGRHQVVNASVALRLAESLREQGRQISRANIVEGIESALHPGRLELREDSPGILFDGAHNAAGAEALRSFLDEFVHHSITMVFGAMRDKELTRIGEILFPAARQLILTEPANPRAATVAELNAIVAGRFKGSVTLEASAPKALEVAYRLTPVDGLICVTGSLYLIGEIAAALERPSQELANCAVENHVI